MWLPSGSHRTSCAPGLPGKQVDLAVWREAAVDGTEAEAVLGA